MKRRRVIDWYTIRKSEFELTSSKEFNDDEIAKMVTSQTKVNITRIDISQYRKKLRDPEANVSISKKKTEAIIQGLSGIFGVTPTALVQMPENKGASRTTSSPPEEFAHFKLLVDTQTVQFLAVLRRGRVVANAFDDETSIKLLGQDGAEAWRAVCLAECGAVVSKWEEFSKAFAPFGHGQRKFSLEDVHNGCFMYAPLQFSMAVFFAVLEERRLKRSKVIIKVRERISAFLLDRGGATNILLE